MWKNAVEPERPHMTIRRMYRACGITKASNTHTECVTLIAFLLQQCLHEGASMLVRNIVHWMSCFWGEILAYTDMRHLTTGYVLINPLKPELNPICYLLALLGAHHFLHVSGIRVKLLTFRLLMSYIYGAPIFDISRSHTTTQHSR